MTIQNTIILDDEIIDNEDEYVLEDAIEWLEDLEKEEEEEVNWHRLETKIRENDGEDNFFDERYFE